MHQKGKINIYGICEVPSLSIAEALNEYEYTILSCMFMVQIRKECSERCI